MFTVFIDLIYVFYMGTVKRNMKKNKWTNVILKMFFFCKILCTAWCFYLFLWTFSSFFSGNRRLVSLKDKLSTCYLGTDIDTSNSHTSLTNIYHYHYYITEIMYRYWSLNWNRIILIPKTLFILDYSAPQMSYSFIWSSTQLDWMP